MASPQVDSPANVESPVIVAQAPNGSASPAVNPGPSHSSFPPPPDAPPAQASSSPSLAQAPQAHTTARPASISSSQNGDVSKNINGTPQPQPATQQQQQNGTSSTKSAVATPQYEELAASLKAAPPEVVRQLVRDHWRLCLAGSEFHIAFILNTTLSQASPDILSRGIQDFGADLARTAKRQWIQHLQPRDVGEIADAILQRADTTFLDRALARRFETISGRGLVNALARSERLGYNVGDIVEENSGNRTEQVIPSAHPSTPNAPQMAAHIQRPPQQPTVSTPVVPGYPVQHPTEAQKALAAAVGIKFCPPCGRPCSSETALEHHIRKSSCRVHVTKLDRFGSDVCLHCGQHFGSSGGLGYHARTGVCGQFDTTTTGVMEKLLAQRSKLPWKPVSNQPVPYSTPTSAPPPAPISPYPGTSPQPSSILDPSMQKKFDDEMAAAEAYYGGKMKEAMQLPQPQQDIELTKIKNSLNSKQSTTRKKYGVRIRVRRSRAQIEADNARMLGQSPSASSTPPPTAAAQQPAAGVKRTLPIQNDSPRKRVPLSEMGGLTGASASAEMTDPTLNMQSSQPRVPPQPQQQQHYTAPASTAGTREYPMDIDGNSPDPRSIQPDGSSAQPQPVNGTAN